MQRSLEQLQERGIPLFDSEKAAMQIILLSDILESLNRIEEALVHPVYNLTIETRE